MTRWRRDELASTTWHSPGSTSRAIELDVLRGARSLLEAGVPLVIEFATAMGTRAQLDELADLLAYSYAAMVDLGWCAPDQQLRFQPAWAVKRLAADGRDAGNGPAHASAAELNPAAPAI